MAYIILDRDGVINYESNEYIKTPDEWIPIPGSLEAIAKLNRYGYKILIATNQSGIGRGYYDLQILNQIHEKMQNALAEVGGVIEEIFICPHHPTANCQCRKPMPGLLHQIQAKYALALQHTYFIGDSLRDIQAARAVGCQPILVLTGNGEQDLANHTELLNIPYFENLAKAVDYVTTPEYERHGD